VVAAVLVFRMSILGAGASALGVALAIWLSSLFSPSEVGHLGRAAQDALVLQLLVGVVIYSGLLFVEVSRRSGTLSAILEVIASTGLNTTRLVILIAVGIGVTVESLTGYGVSLLITVPLLLRVVSRTRAIVAALIGMSLMPWGALSVAALLGAELAGLTVPVLAQSYLTTSGPVAFLLPVLCAVVTGGNRAADWMFALAAGAILVAGIGLTSSFIGVEVAGVVGGAVVILLCFCSTSWTPALRKALRARALWPYPILLGVIVAQKLGLHTLPFPGGPITIATARVSFDVLASPALALIGASLLSIKLIPPEAGGYTERLLGNVSSRSWRALVSVLLFLLTARLLVESGAVAALAGLLSQLGPSLAGATVAVLGGVGAYVTGSGVTSNALFMPSAAETGASLGLAPLFAALQQSGGGHAAMASLPVIALLIAALPSREDSDEPLAVKVGLGLAILWIILVIASGQLQIAMASSAPG